MIEMKIGTGGFLVMLLLVLALAVIIGFEAGIASGKAKMAAMCNIMEQNAGCPFSCAMDGCVCTGAKTIQVIA